MNYKLSHYAILTDALDEENGPASKRILFSARMAQAVVITNEVLRQLETGRFDMLATPVLDELINIEAVVPEEENELQTVITRNNAAIKDETTLSYVIQPTAQCQLGCGYCGQQHTKDALTDEVNARILDRVKEKLEAKKYKHLHIGWFGAEPLMGYRHIRELTPALRAIAADHQCTYGAKIVTNGLSLKENIFLELVEMGVQQFEITLDGTAEYHDLRRYTKEGIHTFDIIFNNVLAILSREDFDSLNVRISIRCNVDARNHEGVIPLIRLFAANKILHKISFYVAPIHSWGNDAHKISLDAEDFANKEIDWTIELFKHAGPRQILPGLNRVVCLAVTEGGELVDAHGNFYNCTEISYVPTYEGTDLVLGNVKNDKSTYRDSRSFTDFNTQISDGKLPCSACQMLPMCGGSCPKSWSEHNQPCPSFKYNLKDKLVLSYISLKSDVRELVV